MLRGIQNCIYAGSLLKLSTSNIKTSVCKMSSNVQPKEICIPVPYGHIAGKVWNEGGIPIFGLHGWMDNAGTWDGLAALLPSELSLITIDFPGHGLSSHLPIGIPNHFINLLVVMERVVQHFQWKEVNLLGHSMGGGAAMMYAATYPEKVKKLVMVDLIKPVSIKPCNQPERTAVGIQEFFEAEKKLSKTAPSYDYDTIVDKMVKSYGFSLTEEAAKTLLKRGSKQLEDGKYSFTYDIRLKTTSMISLTFEQQKAFAERLNCDMLLIKASSGPLYENRELYNEILDIYAKSAKSFKFTKVEGTHHVHLNQPELVAPIINQFFQDKEIQEQMVNSSPIL